MRLYILIESRLFTAQMKQELKGRNPRNGFYMQDFENTVQTVQLLSDGSPTKMYNIISWEQDRPNTVLARYKTTADGGSNYKINWIMTKQEFHDNVDSDIKHD